MNSSAAKFSQELLDFYNNHYLKKFKLENLYEYIDENFSLSEKFTNNDKKTEIIDLLREGSNNISELVDELTFFYEDPYLTDEIINAIQIDKNLLALFKEELKEVNFKDKLLIGVFIDSFLSKNKLKFPLLGKPLRLILTGKSNAPSISDLLYLIGKENCINRIDNYLNS